MRPMTYRQIIKHFGSVLKAAYHLEVSPQAIYGWKKQGIDYQRQCAIEKQTEGKLKAEK